MANELKQFRFRIYDTAVIEGLKAESAAKGISEVNLIREILKAHFNGASNPTVAPTTNLSPEVIEKIENSETLSRILVRKIFDLNESELRDLLNKAKSN